ncbi:hypothetical protein OB955_24995 [Halobacteria archaeon AArc-m2/3/4]|uniref:Uncharacterized protein n=1 Tax=Natronoglomus mannanivorans TaxID=2979990 RepID=A0ABT2QLX1_9EURY|nr:hypothetical protein [Halobacteria archaeon AArc-m2/3/4]
MSAMWIVGGLVALLIVASLVSADPEDRREKAVALFYGGILAGTTYLMWAWYGLDDVGNAWSWATGDGLPVIGALFVLLVGYLWWDTAQSADSGEEFLDELRERTTGPIMRVTGIVTAIVVTLATIGWTGGASLAMILGMFGDIAASSPLELANLGTLVLGWISMGGSIPLVDSVLPDDVSRTWFVGLGLALFGAAVMVKNTGESS